MKEKRESWMKEKRQLHSATRARKIIRGSLVGHYQKAFGRFSGFVRRARRDLLCRRADGVR
jgi:hypothetical protein